MAAGTLTDLPEEGESLGQLQTQRNHRNHSPGNLKEYIRLMGDTVNTNTRNFGQFPNIRNPTGTIKRRDGLTLGSVLLESYIAIIMITKNWVTI